MKKSKKIALTSATGIVLTLIYLTSISTSAHALQPGSPEDPLISRSYLEERLSQLENNNSVSNTVLSDEMLHFIVEDVTRSVLSHISSSGGYVYEPVNASMGQIIIGDEGTEIILRTGSALVYTTTENGLVNITTGEELFSGQSVDKNNTLIVPRDDGRGVLVKSDSWFIIRGAYTIQ